MGSVVKALGPSVVGVMYPHACVHIQISVCRMRGACFGGRNAACFMFPAAAANGAVRQMCSGAGGCLCLRLCRPIIYLAGAKRGTAGGGGGWCCARAGAGGLELRVKLEV